MKNLFLTLISFLGINNLFSQDVSPCHYIEMFVDTVSSDSFAVISVNFDETVNFDGSELEFEWLSVGGNQEFVDNDLLHLLITPNFDYYTTCVEVSGVISETTNNFTCSICNGVYWTGDEWEIGLVVGTPQGKIGLSNSGRYYNLDGKEYKDFNEIPIGSVYILDNKKYVKD